MNAQGLSVTVVGWVATPPKEINGSGVPYTSFRLATTPRRFDSRAGGWTDGRTEWITVKAFRDVAHNVAESVRKGEPLVVVGRLQTEEWQSETGPRTSLVLEASALGHDLARGRTRFARVLRVSPGEQAGEGADGATSSPVPETEDPWATDGAPAPDEVEEPGLPEDPELTEEADDDALAEARTS